MNENEINRPDNPETENPAGEAETILLSTQTPLVLENPLTQFANTATFSIARENRHVSRRYFYRSTG